jgi:hypothetical protein
VVRKKRRRRHQSRITGRRHFLIKAFRGDAGVYLPVDLNDFQYITPLGNMTPPGHTAPTDHIYLVHEWRSAGKPVYAPAGGKILWIQPFEWPDGVEHSVSIGVTKTCTYYMAHLVLDENLKVGDYVQAGQRLGVISRYAAAFDLGVMNRNILQPFVNPKRYGYTQLYGDSPLKYFVEPYKSQLYAKVLREGEDKDGKFCYDQRGKLIGTWVEENAPPDPFKVPDWGRYQLSFAYDVYRPTLIRISLGDDFLALPGDPLSLLPAGLYFVQDGAIPPENVTPSSGKVTYYLYGESGGGEFPPVRGERGVCSSCRCSPRTGLRWKPSATPPPPLGSSPLGPEFTCGELVYSKETTE